MSRGSGQGCNCNCLLAPAPAPAPAPEPASAPAPDIREQQRISRLVAYPVTENCISINFSLQRTDSKRAKVEAAVPQLVKTLLLLLSARSLHADYMISGEENVFMYICTTYDMHICIYRRRLQRVIANPPTVEIRLV